MFVSYSQNSKVRKKVTVTRNLDIFISYAPFYLFSIFLCIVACTCEMQAGHPTYQPKNVPCSSMFCALTEKEHELLIPEFPYFTENISQSLKRSYTTPSTIKLLCGSICSCFCKELGVVA